MTDLHLLLFGCVIMFIALAGLYVYARERFVYTDRCEVPERHAVRRPRGGRSVRAGESRA